MYVEFDTYGRQLHGKRLMLAVSTGAPADSYTPGGRNLFQMKELQRLFEALANRCGMVWCKPFAFHAVNGDSQQGVSAASQAYAARLTDLLAARNFIPSGRLTDLAA
jgi:glutathione-regulated potassium-efflux system ancillary protein KefG